ncbi:TonB-dependent receptor domain-containing protein [Polymorphobacter arshaanensis]|uniref:TonB-dependent receptor domain-containing protein n=1 Tax=Glacieibacterium arshaanense TaxID=2511025 RepID=UPI001FB11C34|nr:TonB-dependent receptor [Polymorphobacter arshaanensis]
MINKTASLSRAALKTSAASIVLAIGIMSTPSFAQEVAATDVDTGESIIVTGSRIARPDLNTASPIQVLGQQEFQLSGAVNVEEVLYDLPQIVPSLTGASNNPGDGAATADLRGLGAARTLVLVNGRRWMSYDVTQIVDLNTIPASLVKRADVLTGGRGAVYGSDAIAGVVNFVLNDEFEGMQVDAGYRLTQQGDGATFNVSATIGTNFANGKGNVTVYGSYAQRDPIFQADRSATSYTLSDDGSGGTFLGGSGSVPGTRFQVNQSKASPTPGCATGASTRNNLFNTDGSFRTYCGATDAFNFAPANYLQVPQERWFMGGFAKYEINEHAEAYTELAFVNNQVNTQLAATPISGNFRVPVNSPFFAGSTQANFLAADAAQTNTVTSNGLVDAPKDGYVTLAIGRRLNEVGPRISKNNRDAYRVLVGMRGEIAGDWRYDGYYTFARTTNNEAQAGNVSRSRFAAALNTTGTTLGTVACAPGAPAAGAACAPLNIYGAGNISPAAADYISISTQNGTTIEEQVANAAITNGNLFDFGWGAAPVGIAFGVEWRSEFGDFNPDTALSSGDVVGFNGGTQTVGSYSVTDLFAEINLPVVADKPGFYNLELNGAYRYSMYSNNVGNASTYSLGGQWAPIKGLTIRGQYQHALRAPSISALYLGQSEGFPGFTDYCTQAVAQTNATLKQSCINNGVPANVVGTAFGSGNAQIRAIFGGNPQLEAETSNTWTAGVAIVPSQIPALSLTVDYYSIDINSAILAAGPGATNVRDACFGDSGNNFTPYDTAYCALIPRDPTTFEVDGLQNVNANAGQISTTGVDFNLQYGMNANFGFANESKFTFRLSGTYLISWENNPISVIPSLRYDCAGLFGATCGDPYSTWRGSARVTWATGPLTTSLLWRYIGGTDDDGTAGVVSTTHLGAASYFDLSGSWNVSKNFSFLLGIDNLFNKGQPIIADGNNQQANGYPSTYDPYGRRFFIGASATF